MRLGGPLVRFNAHRSCKRMPWKIQNKRRTATERATPSRLFTARRRCRDARPRRRNGTMLCRNYAARWYGQCGHTMDVSNKAAEPCVSSLRQRGQRKRLFMTVYSVWFSQSAVPGDCRSRSLLFGCAVLVALVSGVQAEAVFPSGQWERRSPTGFNANASLLRDVSELLDGRGCIVKNGFVIHA